MQTMNNDIGFVEKRQMFHPKLAKIVAENSDHNSVPRGRYYDPNFLRFLQCSAKNGVFLNNQ
jgi:hypothetical protein